MNNIKKNIEPSKGEIIIYRTKDRQVRLEVKLEQDTVWLTQKQIAQLFGTQRPAVTKHLNNIFKSRELQEDSVCSILEHTALDGKKEIKREKQCAKDTFYNTHFPDWDGNRQV